MKIHLYLVKKFVKWYFDIEAHDDFVLALLEKKRNKKQNKTKINK